MASDVLMPKMGYDMEEGKILKWLKQEGETVTKGEPIAEIETDKVSIEIEAFASGVLSKILVPAGGVAPVGSPIGIIGEPGEKVAAPAPAAPTVAAPAAAVAAPAAAAAAAPAAGAGHRVPLSAMRKAIARRMVESKAPVPHFYVTVAVDMDAAMALRAQINENLPKEEKISVNDMIIKACALGLRQHQSLNAQFQGDAIFYPDDIAISVAVATDDGLIAPDIHQADIKSIGAIGKEVKDKATRAKSGGLKPDEYGRGTFTVSNLGMFGVEEFTAIITPPQSAAVAVGGVQQVPVVKNGEIVVGHVMRFTVSADHRVTDGAGSAQFAATVKGLLENPFRLLI